MRGFRLSGWQRIGIVLSIVWAIAAWFYARHVDLALHSVVLSIIAALICRPKRNAPTVQNEPGTL